MIESPFFRKVFREAWAPFSVRSLQVSAPSISPRQGLADTP